MKEEERWWWCWFWYVTRFENDSRECFHYAVKNQYVRASELKWWWWFWYVTRFEKDSWMFTLRGFYLFWSCFHVVSNKLGNVIGCLRTQWVVRVANGKADTKCTFGGKVKDFFNTRVHPLKDLFKSLTQKKSRETEN